MQQARQQPVPLLKPASEQGQQVSWEEQPGAFAHHASWPWLSTVKSVLRDPTRFSSTSALAALHPESFLAGDLPTRGGERPVTTDAEPHAMLTQQSPAAVLEEWISRAAQDMSGCLLTARTFLTMAATTPCFVNFSFAEPLRAPCWLLDDRVKAPKGLKNVFNVREVAHIHAQYSPQHKWTARQGGGAGSMHVTLSPKDAELVIANGWGEWHPKATANHPLVLVYAPLDPSDVDTCRRILAAAVKFHTSAEQ